MPRTQDPHNRDPVYDDPSFPLIGHSLPCQAPGPTHVAPTIRQLTDSQSLIHSFTPSLFLPNFADYFSRFATLVLSWAI